MMLRKILLTISLLLPSAMVHSQCDPQIEICNQGTCAVNVHDWTIFGSVLLGTVPPSQCQSFDTTVGQYIRVVDAINQWGNLLFDTSWQVTTCDTVSYTVNPPDCECTANCLDDVTQECDLSIQPTQTGFPSSSCLDYTWTYTDVSNNQACPEEIVRSWVGTFTGNDMYGTYDFPTLNCNQVITLTDTTAPSIDSPALDYVVECDGAGNTAAYAAWLNNNGGATATDICGELTWSSNANGGLSNDCGTTGQATVTFIVTDDCGNSSSTTATFSIVDTINPVIQTEASDLTAECDGDGNIQELSAWLNNNAGATAADDCGYVTWSNDFSALSDDCGASGSIEVTFTATDNCGNASSTTATFTLVDETNPTITGAINQTVECDGAGNTAAYAAWLNNNAGATASDICGEVTWSNNTPGLSDDCGETGSDSVTFTATDDCGNTSSTTATFTIVDTTVPTIDSPATDMVAACDLSCSDAAFMNWLNSNGGATASDACGGNVDFWTNNYEGPFDCSNGVIAPITVTFEAYDDCGNTTTTVATFSTACIPTAGEWGLLCLTFSLLIVGLVCLREEQALILREG